MATVKLTNVFDEFLASRGMLAEGEVRTTQVDAFVDTGAAMLVLPLDIVDQLGLTEVDRRTVRYANGRRDTKSIVGLVHLEIVGMPGRHGRYDAVSERPGTTPLLGQIVLEDLDLIVDPGSKEIRPDPDSPDMPTVDIS